MNDPRPQPGKFPVVFSTGAGEPSRDHTFSIDGKTLGDVMRDLPGRFTYNPKYAEFKAHAEVDDSEFRNDLVSSALLRLAQQLVHSHVNMNLPQGDFAPVASSDVRVPASISAYLSQFGEFAVPALGTRHLFRDYENMVKKVVFTAGEVRSRGPNGAMYRLWLPMSPGDGNTKLVIASRLADFLRNAEVSILPTVLEDAVLSGEVPDAWEGIKSFLGDEPGEGEVDTRDRFDFLFKAYGDVGQFLTAFTTPVASGVLAELSLPWPSPSAGHLNWQYNVKSEFTRLADIWARKSAAYSQFFEMTSAQTSRPSATGSQSQMAIVSDVESVTVVKTHLALSAPEFSLVACFPATATFTGGLSRRVVVTTPLSAAQRATEFCQLDWR
jgi:hypothetical protein